MEKMHILKKIVLTCSAVFALLFASCSDISDSKSSSEQSNFSVTGKVALGNALPSSLALASEASEDASLRSATSSFDCSKSSGSFSVTASLADSDKKIEGSFDSEKMTYSVVLDEAGSWKVEIKYQVPKDGDTESVEVMSGETTIDLKEIVPGETSSISEINLVPCILENVSGAIDLDLTVPSSVSSVNYSSLEVSSAENPVPLISGTANVSSGTATITKNQVPSGSYTLKLDFLNLESEIVYTCQERVNVFPGFTTDLWYGTDDHISDDKFVLTQALIDEAEVLSTEIFDSPIVIWNKDTTGVELSDEDARISGFNLFSSISENAKIGDGRYLAKGKIVKTYAYDSTSKAFFTLEQSSSGSYTRIVRYPAEHPEYGKLFAIVEELVLVEDQTVYQNVVSMTADNDVVYLMVSVGKPNQNDGTDYNYVLRAIDSDGQVVDSYLKDDQDSYLIPSEEYSGNLPTVVLTTFGNYIYLAYFDSTSPVSIKLVKINKTPDTDEKAVIEKTASVDASSFKTNSSSTMSAKDISVTEISDTGTLVHILFTDMYKYDYLFHGGIFTFKEGSEGFEQVNVDGSAFETDPQTSSPIVTLFGFNSSGTPSDENDSEYFYGPCKFIAKKPEELVIADEGGYKTSNNAKNKNRVVKVNLKDASMSVTDVKVSFDSYVTTGSYQYLAYN